MAALVGALAGRYPDQPYWILPEAWPMIVLMAGGYLLHAFFMSFRHEEFFGDYLTLAVSSLLILILLATLVLTLTRQYFSLGFIFVFALVTVFGSVLIERWRARRQEAPRLMLLKVGRWALVQDCPLIDRVIEPTDLDQSELKTMAGVVCDFDLERESKRDELVAELIYAGIEVYPLSDLFEYWQGRVLLSGGYWDLVSRRGLVSFYWHVKRVLDITVSALCLGILAAPMFLIWFAVRIDSPGPGIFRQQRTGFKEKNFTIYKFRTMHELGHSELRLGLEFGSEADRVTKVGSYLRRWRIDEWPQFLNVLKGDMSLVGPRPEIPNLVKLYAEEIPHFKLRNLIRPGITGWAQIKQGHTSGIEEAKQKLEYDLYYLKHANLTVDLTVLIHTIKVLLCGSERNFGSSDH